VAQKFQLRRLHAGSAQSRLRRRSLIFLAAAAASRGNCGGIGGSRRREPVKGALEKICNRQVLSVINASSLLVSSAAEAASAEPGALRRGAGISISFERLCVQSHASTGASPLSWSAANVRGPTRGDCAATSGQKRCSSQRGAAVACDTGCSDEQTTVRPGRRTTAPVVRKWAAGGLHGSAMVIDDCKNPAMNSQRLEAIIGHVHHDSDT